MGMYDDINLFQDCPHCKQWGELNLQTKDLECCLYAYFPLAEDWFNSDSPFGGKKMRKGLPEFPRFPLDKAANVWVSQAERIEAQASPSKEFGEQLKYIKAYGHCPKCGAWLGGKIKIDKGMLIGKLFDVTIEIAKGGIIYAPTLQ